MDREGYVSPVDLKDDHILDIYAWDATDDHKVQKTLNVRLRARDSVTYHIDATHTQWERYISSSFPNSSVFAVASRGAYLLPLDLWVNGRPASANEVEVNIEPPPSN
jgi:hypothetical protein